MKMAREMRTPDLVHAVGEHEIVLEDCEVVEIHIHRDAKDVEVLEDVVEYAMNRSRPSFGAGEDVVKVQRAQEFDFDQGIQVKIGVWHHVPIGYMNICKSDRRE